MVSLVAREKTRTSEVGNLKLLFPKPSFVRDRAKACTQGFTLLELLLVVCIVGIAAAAVTLALRDSAQSRLETQAQRLAAILESFRAKSRANGVPLRWRATKQGYILEELGQNPREPMEQTWSEPGIASSSDQPVLLGPEPLVPAATIRMWLEEQPLYVLRIATDGVRPFAVVHDAP